MPLDPNAPAFPGVEGANGYGNAVPGISPGGEPLWVNYQQGINVRAWIATTIAAGMLAAETDNAVMSPGPATTAERAVFFADALIAKLNEQK